MIKINLLGDDTVIDTSGTWLVIAYGLSLGTLILVWVWMVILVNSSIDDLTNQAETLDRQLKALQETTKKVRELEKKKKELADKTDIIGILKKNKLGPVRVLDDLNNALPERAWILDIKEGNGMFRISGMALDNQTIAAFMKALEASSYFDTIDLGESRQIEKEGVKMKQFVLQAKVNYAGFEKKRTVASPSPSPTPDASPEAVSSPGTEESPAPDGTPIASEPPQGDELPAAEGTALPTPSTEGAVNP